MTVQDIAVQSQALLNVKDSNKVLLSKQAALDLSISVNNLTSRPSLGLMYLQEERERMVVRRFKFEEPRIEQIQDLEVCICMFG